MVFSNWSLNEGVDQAALFEEEEEDQYEVEDENARISYVFSYESNHNTNSLKDSELVISVGNAASSFIKTYVDLPQYDIIAQYLPSTKDTGKSSKHQTCQLLKRESTVLCLLQYHVEDKDFASWVENLIKEINPTNVSVISSSPRSNFIGLNRELDSDADFLRCLKSLKCSLSTRVKPLEEGNMVRNLPAAVMRYCSAFKRSCILYIAYMESHFVDVFTLKTIAPVLQDISLFQVKDNILQEKLRNFEGCGVADNNVYI